MRFDLPLSELREYQPEIAIPPDFDKFWSEQRALADFADGRRQLTRYADGLTAVDTWDLVFPGHNGSQVRAWLLLPTTASRSVPVVVSFLGYGAGRGLPLEHLLWPAAGYAAFVMDMRGQGAVWSVGETSDPGDAGDPSAPGFVTRGILAPTSYYYKRAFVDAYCAIRAAREHEAIDAERVVVSGASQGGLLALAAAALGDVAAVLVDVPFLCHVQRAIEITDTAPYSEIATFLRARPDDADSALKTLEYFDGANLATRAKAPALFSVGLQDMVCPPSTVFAALNRYGGHAEIEVYPFGGHEVSPQHRRRQMAWLQQVLG